MSTWPSLPKQNSDCPSDIEGALIELGIEPTEITDTDITALCPYHDEGKSTQKKPKWAILTEGYYNEKGEWIKPGMHNCFSCNFRGDFRWLVMKVLDCDALEADSWIAQHSIIDLDRAREKLYKEPSAKAPLILINESHLAAFKLVPPMQLLKRRLTEKSAEFYGVKWDGENYVIPIRDGKGHLLGWQLKNEKFFKNYPYGLKKSHCLFGYHEAPANVTIILVESPLDVVYLHSLGYWAVASYGKAVSDEQMKLIIDKYSSVIVALDQDAKTVSLRLKREFSHRIPMWFFNYDGITANDPGACTEIRLVAHGIGDAIFSAHYS